MPKYFDILINTLRRVCLVVIGVALVACVDEKSTPESELQPIQMAVSSADMLSTRALINTTDNLKKACTPAPEGDGKSIGIWSSYTLDGQQTTNVLGNPTGDVALKYIANTEWDNLQGWTYGEEAVFWVNKAKYTFNAYYPMEVVDEISTSDVSTFVIDYNTEHYQEDLMMAYAFADTNAPDFNVSRPVELNMLHTLSAVQFRFMFMNSDDSTYDDSDRLTACWVENSAQKRGIATTGVLAFGTESGGVVDGEHIHWYYEDYPEPPTANKPRRIYAWEDAAGVPFSSTTTSHTPAVAYSTGNQMYSSNNGWLLVIPQATDGSAKLCFKLASTGDVEHRVAIPATNFEAGYRYTYNIRFGQSSVTLTLKIADWNELKSSHNIAL